MDRRAHRHHLVGIDAFVWLAAKEFLHHRLNPRHPRHPADQEYLVELLRRQSGVLEGNSARLDGPIDQVFHQRFEFCAVNTLGQMLGAAGVGGDEGQIDVCLSG